MIFSLNYISTDVAILGFMANYGVSSFVQGRDVYILVCISKACKHYKCFPVCMYLYDKAMP